MRWPGVPNTVTAWGWYNFGSRLMGVERTRRDCKLEAERVIGKPWAECKKSIQIYKVTVALWRP